MSEFSSQAVPFSAGVVYVTWLRKSDGSEVIPPQTIAIDGLQDAKWEDKRDLKELHGSGGYATRVGAGKKSINLSITVSELSGRQLNTLLYGKDVIEKQVKISNDKSGWKVPITNEALARIQSNITVNLSRIDSLTSVSIGGVAANTTVLATIGAGFYKFSNGIVSFSAADINKTAVITYVSNGVTMVSTLKVPEDTTYAVKLYTSTTSIRKGSVLLSRSLFSYTAGVPFVDFYMASPNGVVIFNPTQTGVMTVAHRTDGANVTTVINTLPAPAFGLYIDAPSSSNWMSTTSVELSVDTSTAMTGMVPGSLLTKQATLAAVTSGQFFVDTKGYHVFHSADAGDMVKINYVSDFQYFVANLPEGGTFLQDMGVSVVGGVNLTRVELTNPVSLLKNQYAVSENGSYYFNFANGDDTVLIDYKYEVMGIGKTIAVDNQRMGASPTVAIDFLSEMDGEMLVVSFPMVKVKGSGIATKQDDFAPMQFEMIAFADKRTGQVYSISTSA